MKSKKISTGIHYPKPLPALNCYKSHKIDLSEFPNSTKDARQILSLPIFPEITEKQVKYVSDKIKNFYTA